MAPRVVTTISYFIVYFANKLSTHCGVQLFPWVIWIFARILSKLGKLHKLLDSVSTRQPLKLFILQ